MENITYYTGHSKCPPLFALSPSCAKATEGRPKILLVEDNSIARTAEKLILESLGCEVVTAKDGEEGLKYFNSKLQAVVLDIDLPGISGITVAQAIRKNNFNIPIIACTSSHRFSEAEYVNAGINLVLEKPMRIKKTYTSLMSYMQQQVH